MQILIVCLLRLCVKERTQTFKNKNSRECYNSTR